MEFVSHDDCPKTLGLHWNTLKDDMYVSIPKIEYHGKLTKRQLVSNIAKVYDVMGWLSPVILFAKSLLQQVWESRVDWDDSVPGNILADWSRWVSELPVLSHRCIPRCMLIPARRSAPDKSMAFLMPLRRDLELLCTFEPSTLTQVSQYLW